MARALGWTRPEPPRDLRSRPAQRLRDAPRGALRDTPGARTRVGWGRPRWPVRVGDHEAPLEPVAVLGALLGAVLGLAFGVALTRGLAEEGLTVLDIPSDRLGLYAVAAAFAGVLAAIGPARRAAKVDVLQAVATA